MKQTSLLINTATIVGVAGIAVEGEVVSQASLQLAMSSNGTVAAIDRLLTDTGSSIDEVQEIILVRGPGTFTGSRVGASIAKAIAYVTSCSLVSVSTLEALAWSGFLQSPADLRDGSMWALLDARHHEFYAERFEVRDRQLQPGSGAVCRDLDVFAEVRQTGGIAACAFAASVVPQEENVGGHDNTTWLFDMYPTCAGILAASQVGRREDPFVFEPVYLRTLEELFDHPTVTP
ncbi:tRNA (adenosine(37)-N6)-threonylcarbamoyltransferase complex dimerization subunit type 1 TsaB [bacterium]|nr:tRNA (adenosine(37)-N6)-threonylcarbamoyltransferase complex dimerization subunit type 1 TsaB [bacterium]